MEDTGHLEQKVRRLEEELRQAKAATANVVRVFEFLSICCFAEIECPHQHSKAVHDYVNSLTRSTRNQRRRRSTSQIS
jgi:hypothetical protein